MAGGVNYERQNWRVETPGGEGEGEGEGGRYDDGISETI